MNQIKIPNKNNELLDVWIEGEENSRGVVILAHGIGTNKHETTGQFDDITQGLLSGNHIVVRFDFSGFGNSEGKSEDFDFQKGADDLRSVLIYVKENFNFPTHLISQSMATAITCFLQPKGVEKIVFTAPVNPDGESLVNGMQNRIKNRGGKVNKNGISIYPRSSGEVQKYGHTLWNHMKNLNFIEKCKELGSKSDLLLIRPKQDQIVVDIDTSLLKDQKEFKYIEIDGDHSFSGEKNRDQLIKKIIDHLK